MPEVSHAPSKLSDQFQSIHTPVSREWGEEGGDNPVFIDGKKCRRCFRFGTVGMYDPYNCPTLEEFHHRVFPPAEDFEDLVRNHRDLNADTGSRILNTKDGVPTYVMLYNGPMMPGAVSHAEAGGHTHPWDHVIYVLEGSATLRCDGKDYAVTEGDAVLVPPNSLHQWKNETDAPMVRVTFNAIESVAHEG